MDKLIITVALTGNVPTKEMNPNLPVTTEEIAANVRRCADCKRNRPRHCRSRRNP